VNRQQISENQAAVEQRFSDLTEFEVKGNTVVHFAPGKAGLSKQNQAALLELATNAKNLKGYLIEVKGYCDSTGNPAQNQELSRDRAEAVIEFLHQQGQIPVRRVLAPGAMAVTEPVASNETTSGRAENRRVEVKVLVNRGLAASASQ
jgi:OmpA-OmpF porin, OOP family